MSAELGPTPECFMCALIEARCSKCSGTAYQHSAGYQESLDRMRAQLHLQHERANGAPARSQARAAAHRKAAAEAGPRPARDTLRALKAALQDAISDQPSHDADDLVEELQAILAALSAALEKGEPKA